MSARIGTICNENNADSLQVYTSSRGIELYGPGSPEARNAIHIANLTLAQAESLAAMLQNGVRAIREQRRERRLSGYDGPQDQ